MGDDQPLVNINGLAHVILTVTDYEKSRQFYTRLLPAFGMTLVHDGPDFCYGKRMKHEGCPVVSLIYSPWCGTDSLCLGGHKRREMHNMDDIRQ